MDKSIVTAEDAKKYQELKIQYIEIQSEYKKIIEKINEIENPIMKTLCKACLVPLGVLKKYMENELKKEGFFEKQ